MPARLAQIVLRNNSSFPIRWLTDHLYWGDWQNPWWPSKIEELPPGGERAFRSESGGPFSGTHGWAMFTIEVPFAANVGDRVELLRIEWDLPYWLGPKDPSVSVSFRTPGDRPSLTYAKLVPPRLNMATNQPIVGEFLSNLVIPVVLFQGVVPEHISWTVEVRDVEGSSSVLPLRLAKEGIVYVITPVVEAALPIGIGAGMGGHPESGGDLMWCRHIGRDYGSFAWQGPKEVGTGWGDFKQVFSGGKGIIYGIDPVVEAGVHITGGTIHPSGGNLWWYRHVGWEDGSFSWRGPEKVGIGWGEFSKVFSGGDGILYAITPVVEARLDIETGRKLHASGGDLMWYRHVGHEDGSFTWEGPHKVGVGWGEFTQVFSGGDGIVYAITPVVEASVDVKTGRKLHATGGDLMWYRHVGREDGSFTWEGPHKVGVGWGEFAQVFSGGDGILYAITPIVEARVDVKTGRKLPASGGDLMWYRHVGREAGSFTWEGPKKVGNGWGELHSVFSGD